MGRCIRWLPDPCSPWNRPVSLFPVAPALPSPGCSPGGGAGRPHPHPHPRAGGGGPGGRAPLPRRFFLPFSSSAFRHPFHRRRPSTRPAPPRPPGPPLPLHQTSKSVYIPLYTPFHSAALAARRGSAPPPGGRLPRSRGPRQPLHTLGAPSRSRRPAGRPACSPSLAPTLAWNRLSLSLSVSLSSLHLFYSIFFISLFSCGRIFFSPWRCWLQHTAGPGPMS